MMPIFRDIGRVRHVGEIAGHLQFGQDFTDVLLHPVAVVAARSQDLDAHAADRRLLCRLTGEGLECPQQGILVFLNHLRRDVVLIRYAPDKGTPGILRPSSR